MGRGLKKRTDRQTDRHCVDFNIDVTIIIIIRIILILCNFLAQVWIWSVSLCLLIQFDQRVKGCSSFERFVLLNIYYVCHYASKIYSIYGSAHIRKNKCLLHKVGFRPKYEYQKLHCSPNIFRLH